MILALIIFIAFIVMSTLFIKINSTKMFLTSLTIIIIFATGWICIQKPVMHKFFSISMINYLIKFNTDNSLTTIKQTTTTQIKKDKE